MVSDFIKKSSNLFFRRQSNILSAAMVLMTTVLLSRILGLFRDRLLAGTFFVEGNQWQLDAYFAAFRIPDMLFQLVVLGALSAAFIPVFSHHLEKDIKEAWKIANGVITLSCIAFTVLAIGIYIFAYPLSNLIAPDFEAHEIELMVQLTRVMLVAQFFFVISNFFTGILQSHQRFILPALAPVLYNVGIILGILVLSPYLGIYGPAIGVVLGSVLHLLTQTPLVLKLGFRYQPLLGIQLKGVRKIGRLMIPRTIGLAVNQIELTIAVFFATAMSQGSLSIFYFAQHLIALPVGLFGLTIGQAALPILSKESNAADNYAQFKSLLISSLNLILYLALPASVLLLVLRVPLVRIAYGAKSFPWEATLLTGQVVAVFAISITAQAMIQLLVRAFYALQDTKTPLIIGALAVIVNVSLSWWFIDIMGMNVIGLGIAMTIATLFQAVMLFATLNKRMHGFEINTYLVPMLKMFVATALTGVALWLPMRFLDQFVLDTTRTIQLIMLTIVASASGLMVYLIFSKILQIQELDRMLAALKRFGAWKSVLSESDEVLTETSASSPAIQE